MVASISSCFFDQLQGAGFDLEAKALLKAYGAQHAGGIIDKGQGMQYAHQPALQVVETTPMVIQVAVIGAIETKSKGVDGEITAVQIQFDAAAFHSGQGSGIVIKFRA